MEENHIIPQLDAKKWSLIAGSGSLQNGLRRLGDHPGCFKKCSLSSTGKKAHTAIRYPVRDHRPSGPAPRIPGRGRYSTRPLRPANRRNRAEDRTTAPTGPCARETCLYSFQRRLVCSRAPF